MADPIWRENERKYPARQEPSVFQILLYKDGDKIWISTFSWPPIESKYRLRLRISLV